MPSPRPQKSTATQIRECKTDVGNYSLIIYLEIRVNIFCRFRLSCRKRKKDPKVHHSYLNIVEKKIKKNRGENRLGFSQKNLALFRS